MTRIVCIGECMVELAQAGPGTYRRGFAGDTFNTAWYARRLLPLDASVGYVSCIGDDAMSDQMADFMQESGIETDHLHRIPGRSVGLYMISTRDGERSFSYWRDTSAARSLADDPARLDRALEGADMAHVSGITLAILTPESRTRLCAALDRARAAGTTVSFDTNLRPRLWEDEATMRDGLTRGAAAADIVLPSFEEEQGLFGDATPEDTIARYREGGAGTVVVKNGAAEVTFWSDATGTERLQPAPVEHVIDTTAAGDSFAGALLAGLAGGTDLRDAVRAAIDLSGRVIQAPGALVEDAITPEA
ncbi:2-keto-3-deoxygluconate kinase [Palleronia marisminoris]|uniref:2-dehydro-3-deoxygluconokinase n=1 Tax=Palleronia marisminoris TaxID=315423 RepID=A0A1Y5S8Q5_9RHOB|nr:sugar kinase [Palleronia marisminoris]SFG67327.1 2-keto-3-deoxygluconate kinase [Palleronia marisminoris]SLN34329.1 2-dehydro-3-deoxygluconokinase [Palleronia marisminoris]